MKKVYSLIFLLCSFSMAGFAIPALSSSQLPSDSSPGASGLRTVVRSSTILNGETRSVAPVNSFYQHANQFCMELPVCSNGWLLCNNNRSTTANNTTGSVPGAGFLMPSCNSGNGCNNNFDEDFSDGHGYRSFAFYAPSSPIIGKSVARGLYVAVFRPTSAEIV